MGNIITYLIDSSEKSFIDKPFSLVDNLVLCQLSYLIYDDVLSNKKTENEFINFSIFNTDKSIKKLCEKTLEPKKNIELLNNLFTSKRYDGLKIGFYQTIFSIDKEIQFAAMVFMLPNQDLYIAFRGTDISILGWKEDFNMAFIEEIPSQKLSVKYLNEIFYKLPEAKNIYVGGHSKGGNLATYSAITCNKDIQDKITLIFDNDGPGFKKYYFDKTNFKNIENKIKKIIPYDSWIGIILNHYSHNIIIKSRGIAVLQHDPFNWKVENDDFIYLESRSQGSLALEKSLYSWLEEMNDEKRKEVVDLIYEVFSHEELNFVTDFKVKTLKKLKLLYGNYHSLSKNEQIELKSSIKKFIKIYLSYRFLKKQSQKENKKIQE